MKFDETVKSNTYCLTDNHYITYCEKRKKILDLDYKNKIFESLRDLQFLENKNNQIRNRILIIKIIIENM